MIVGGPVFYDNPGGRTPLRGRVSVQSVKCMAVRTTVKTRPTEPRWPAVIALLAVGCLWMALPERLSLGPGWLLLAVVFALLLPIVFSHRRGYQKLNRVLSLVANAVITLAMISSLIFLIEGLPSHRETQVSCCVQRPRYG
jgi:hypothetical protein